MSGYTGAFQETAQRMEYGVNHVLAGLASLRKVASCIFAGQIPPLSDATDGSGFLYE